MNRRVVGWTVSLVCLVLVATFAPLPDLERLRDWAGTLGPWFPVAFFTAYALVTVAPVPRSTFTYSAAVLFTPAVAITWSLVASAVAASLAFGVVRRLGHRRTAALRAHPRFVAVDVRLRRRGWLSICSLRMVPAVPYSVVNYAAALTSVRFRQFLPATVIGSAPGTVAAVLLGHALTGGEGSTALWATAAIAGVGLVGLVVDSRLPVRGSTPDDRVDDSGNDATANDDTANDDEAPAHT